ncbi:uncharacterized protein DUF563 [Rhizobium sp. PP-WC-1G-195]|nr:uncharacterized protein DUF563 [Rhizobium sp. PP-WC-1G-195]TCP76361.1 uncharacterized protein DUF563 [Rhizobium sp. PP-CC-2G-626]
MRKIEEPNKNFTCRIEMPVVEVHRESVYMPMTDGVPFEQNPNWGLYTCNGTLVDAAAYYRGEGKNLVGQSFSQVMNSSSIEIAPPRKYLYGGPVFSHYGHFLLSTISRLWLGVDEDLSSYTIVCHGQGTVEGWWSFPYIRELFLASGLRRENFVVFKRPTMFKQIEVPRPAYEEHNFVHRVFGEWGNQVGQSMLRDTNLIENPKPVWLSKSRIASGVQGVVNEHELDERLEQCGFDVIHPQTLSVREQVALYATRRNVMGTLSSAFHTTILCKPKAKLVCITAEPSVNSNYPLVDLANGNNITYFQAEAEVISGDSRYLKAFRFLDVDSIVSLLSEQALH